jgi:prevent-host-death family protein
MLSMRVTTAEAKNRLSALLDEVASGGEVTITRRGKAVAKLVSAVPNFDRQAARDAAAGLKAASRGVTLGDVSLEDLVNDGRR